MRYSQLYKAFMWLVRLLFLVTIGYAASDIATDSDNEEDTNVSDTTLHSSFNRYIPATATELTVIRLSSFTDSMTT